MNEISKLWIGVLMFEIVFLNPLIAYLVLKPKTNNEKKEEERKAIFLPEEEYQEYCRHFEFAQKLLDSIPENERERSVVGFCSLGDPKCLLAWDRWNNGFKEHNPPLD